MYFDEKNSAFNYVLNDKDQISEENNYNNNFININYNRNAEIMNLTDGFNKGNMFADLYEPYKNYEFNVTASGKKEMLLLEIQKLAFACKDLNLYLDLNPKDTKVLSVFLDCAEKLKKYKEEYARLYNPICATDTVNKQYFNYVQSPWPWNGERSNYV